MSLIQRLNQKALALAVPISVHVDVTYRCNERCEHCYLEHDDRGEMTTGEIQNLFDQLAEEGVFFLTISGGEPLVRSDWFEIIEYARALEFNVKLKTNAILIGEYEAKRIKALGVEQIQISLYSHRAEVHDEITKVRGSLQRTLAGIRVLRAEGLKVSVANVLMKSNSGDGEAVRALASEFGAHYTLDPTITPMIDGRTDVLRYRASAEDVAGVFRNSALVGNVEEFCAPPQPVDEDILDGLPCSAGHTACYISPYGDLYPCVQFPLLCGNVRRQPFREIWSKSPQLSEVRSIHGRDLPTCSACSHLGTCSRCPGLAYMEGNMRGPSSVDREKSFIRTGIPSAGMLMRVSDGQPVSGRSLVQIQLPS